MIEAIRYHYSRFGIDGVISAIKAKLTHSNVLITVNRRDIKFPLYLRCRTSDIATFDQVFVDHEYDFDIPNPPRVIVDAGANIGLASIYFANRYPGSKIIAIEPEASNYALLKRNVAPYPHVIPVNAALWNRNEEISLVDPGLGKWGFMTQKEGGQEESLGNVCHKVAGVTIDKLIKDNGITRIDILKMDIEGAEREVFSDSSPWIEKVDALIVELHENMKSGCNRSFYNGSNGFDIEWRQGENFYLSRGQLTRPKSQIHSRP